MKKSILLLALLVIAFKASDAQIKKPIANTKVKTTIINPGIKIKNIKNLSVNDLVAKNIPLVSVTKKQLNAKPITSWKIMPINPMDNLLFVQRFYGLLSKTFWQIESSPFFDGATISYWNAGRLDLAFRQSKNVEYRMKIKLLVTGTQNKSLFVHVGQMSGRYPVNPDGIVNVIWTAPITGNPRISIGHLLPNNYKISDYPRGLPKTIIESVTIDKI